MLITTTMLLKTLLLINRGLDTVNLFWARESLLCTSERRSHRVLTEPRCAASTTYTSSTSERPRSMRHKKALNWTSQAFQSFLILSCDSQKQMVCGTTQSWQRRTPFRTKLHRSCKKHALPPRLGSLQRRSGTSEHMKHVLDSSSVGFCATGMG